MLSIYHSIIDKLYRYSIDHFVNYRRHLKEYFWAILIALVLRATVITIYKIPTGSMIPTFNIGDVLIANRFYYGLKMPFTEGREGWRIKIPGLYKKPGTGDIIIFRGPEEHWFYFLAIRVNSQEAKNLMHEVNHASSFKRPNYIKNGFTNYISYRGNLEDEGVIMLHHSVYEKYVEEFRNTQGLDFLIRGKNKVYMTYKEHWHKSFWKNFLDTPMAGSSIVGTVLLNTPLAILPKFFLVSSGIGVEKEIFGLEGQLIPFFWRFANFSLYPNGYVDMTKDFVKRIVAEGGDVVEIKDRKLYVNGVKRHLEFKEIVEESYQGVKLAFNVYQSIYTNEKKDEVIRHRVRYLKDNVLGLFSPDSQYPPFLFDGEMWPYDPTIAQEYGYFRKDLGPITVPENHYFALGDNRDESLDGRFWGCVPHWAIKGTAMFKILPPSKIK